MVDDSEGRRGNAPRVVMDDVARRQAIREAIKALKASQRTTKRALRLLSRLLHSAPVESGMPRDSQDA